MSKVAVFLSNGFADWEYALIAGTGGPYYGLDVRFFAPESGKVRSQGGLECVVPYGSDEISVWGPSVVVVIGSSIWTTVDAPEIGGVLVDHHAQGGVVAGICGGTLALARAGLLDAVGHTSNELGFLQDNAEEYGGAAMYRESASAVSEGGVITAPGTAPVSFSAAVFEGVGLDVTAVSQLRQMLAAEHMQFADV